MERDKDKAEVSEKINDEMTKPGLLSAEVILAQ